MRKNLALTVMLLNALLVCVGCTSFSSTMMSRLDNNSFYGNSNGEPKKHNQTRPFRGIPITLRVPTHLDVFIDEIYYLSIEEEKLVDCLASSGTSTRMLDVRAELVESDKVFTVDFKRPGSGILDLNLDLNEDQYFQKIVSELEDTTIKDAAALAAQVVDSVGKFSARSVSSGLTGEDRDQLLKDNNLLRERRTVAFQRFDINAVDFEQQVQAFADKHLNACNQCGITPTYDR